MSHEVTRRDVLQKTAAAAAAAAALSAWPREEAASAASLPKDDGDADRDGRKSALPPRDISWQSYVDGTSRYRVYYPAGWRRSMAALSGARQVVAFVKPRGDDNDAAAAAADDAATAAAAVVDADASITVVCTAIQPDYSKISSLGTPGDVARALLPTSASASSASASSSQRGKAPFGGLFGGRRGRAAETVTRYNVLRADNASRVKSPGGAYLLEYTATTTTTTTTGSGGSSARENDAQPDAAITRHFLTVLGVLPNRWLVAWTAQSREETWPAMEAVFRAAADRFEIIDPERAADGNGSAVQ